LVRKAYNKIKSGDVVTLDDIAKCYDPTRHPDVTSGKEKAEAHYKHFISLFQSFGATKPADSITLEQFEQLYRALSSCYPDDKAFAAVIQAEWHI
jgi:hypothetical protein